MGQAASRAEGFSQWAGPSPRGVRASFQLRPQEAPTAAGSRPGGGRGVPGMAQPLLPAVGSRRIGQSQGLGSRDAPHRAGPVAVGTTSQPLLPGGPPLSRHLPDPWEGVERTLHTLAGKGARVRAPGTYGAASRRNAGSGGSGRPAIRVSVASPVRGPDGSRCGGCRPKTPTAAWATPSPPRRLRPGSRF